MLTSLEGLSRRRQVIQPRQRISSFDRKLLKWPSCHSALRTSARRVLKLLTRLQGFLRGGLCSWYCTRDQKSSRHHESIHIIPSVCDAGKARKASTQQSKSTPRSFLNFFLTFSRPHFLPLLPLSKLPDLALTAFSRATPVVITCASVLQQRAPSPTWSWSTKYHFHHVG